jgi:hypothetical protein
VHGRTRFFVAARLLEGGLGTSEKGGSRVRHSWELESDRTVLECYRCGEVIILLGSEEDWHTEGNIFFECQCGQRLAIAPKPL